MNIANAVIAAINAGTPAVPNPSQQQPPISPTHVPATSTRAGGNPSNNPSLPHSTTPRYRNAKVIEKHIQVGTLVVLMIWLSTVFCAIYLAVYYLAERIELSEELYRTIVTWTSVAIWLLTLKPAFPLFIKSVPEYSALVTVDTVFGTLRTYGTGTFLTYPWEYAKPENLVSLERVTIPLKKTFPTRTSGAVDMAGSLRFFPTLEGAANYIGIDETTIKLGFVDTFLHSVGEEIARLDPDDIFANISAIQQRVISDYEKNEGKKHILEKEFGVEFEGFNFTLDPDDAIKNARNQIYEAQKRKEASKTFEGVEEKALEAFLIDQRKLTKTITEIRGLESIGATAGAIIASLVKNPKSAAEIAEQIGKTIKR